MRRFSIVGPLCVALAAGACSLLNAPEDVIPGSGGHASSGGTCATDGDCPASDVPCTRYACALGGVCQLVTFADGTTCDDGHWCTVGDTCIEGKCVGERRTCPGEDYCNIGVCDDQTKACSIGPAPTGTACDDGDPCTEDGACNAGKCEKGPDACAKLVTDCVDAQCMPGIGCQTQNKLDGAGCGMSFCSNGTCKAGHCDIVPINEGESCDDGKFCTVNETCQNGYCLGDPNPCPTGDPCVKGVCDEASQSCTMTPIPDDSPCDDGDACTANEFCSMHQCIGGLPPTTLFSEDFSDASKGWVLGPEWQIGHAKASSGQDVGNGDPGFDWTGEGGVAGVEIGGNAWVESPDPTHSSYYLTSPPIDTMRAGAIYLTFYRWLNSDIDPFMDNTVEVSTDGAAWHVIWSTADVPVTDDAWTFQALDISAYKSKGTLVRWGFSIGEDYVYHVSSWNLDDVKVQNAPCPN